VARLRIVNGRLWNRSSEVRTPNSELQRGFTLIEIIIVIVILSIVSVVTINFLANSLKTYSMMVNQKVLFDEGKLALERMCREIRDAKSITLPASGSSGNTVTFTRTHDTGPGQDTADEIITFRLNGNILEKVKVNVGYAIAGNVSSFTVTRATTDDEITMVLILSLGTGENMTQQTKVYPKNLPKSATYKNFFQNWMDEVSS